jgi:hypothetical protein
MSPEVKTVLISLVTLLVYRSIEQMVNSYLFRKQMNGFTARLAEQSGLSNYVGGDVNLSVKERAIKRINALGTDNSGIVLNKDKAYLGKNTEHGPVYEDVDVAFFEGVELPLSHEEHEEVAKAFNNQAFRERKEQEKQTLTRL